MDSKKNKFLIKSYKQMFLVIGIFTLVLLVGGTTYAFFNYTRTGSANTLNTGRIYFSTEQTNNNTITLNNVFPMTKEQALADSSTNGTLVVTFTGDTTYTDGIEYLLTIDEVTRTANVPISLIMDVDVTSTPEGSSPVALTENANYYAARNNKDTSMYKAEGVDTVINSTNHKVITDINTGKYLLAGYIKSGTDVINGTITIKAFIDSDKILISDTYPESDVYTLNTNMTNDELQYCISYLTNDLEYDGDNVEEFCRGTGSYSDYTFQDFLDENLFGTTELNNFVSHNVVSYYYNGTPNSMAEGKTLVTTTEWNQLQSNGISFKVKGEANPGIWVDGTNTLYGLMKMSSQGGLSDFSNTSHDDGTSGVYETVEGVTPIYYYRGVVDNNVIFGDYCWKAVRTTVTKGVKLIFNGEVVNDKCEAQTGNPTSINNGGISRFNSSTNNSKYVGYTYDNDGTVTDSSMKQYTDSWYLSATTNNKIDETKIETTTYCNDISTSSVDGSNINYGAYDRLDTHKNPTLNCPNNGVTYSLKAGFLTADEVVFAGGKYNRSNNTYYLYNNDEYWIASPYYYYNNNTAFVFSINSNGFLKKTNVISCFNVRPIVSIVPGMEITRGDGTPTNPYVVE